MDVDGGVVLEVEGGVPEAGVTTGLDDVLGHLGAVGDRARAAGDPGELGGGHVPGGVGAGAEAGNRDLPGVREVVDRLQDQLGAHGLGTLDGGREGACEGDEVHGAGDQVRVLEVDRTLDADDRDRRRDADQADAVVPSRRVEREAAGPDVDRDVRLHDDLLGVHDEVRRGDDVVADELHRVDALAAVDRDRARPAGHGRDDEVVRLPARLEEVQRALDDGDQVLDMDLPRGRRRDPDQVLVQPRITDAVDRDVRCRDEDRLQAEVRQEHPVDGEAPGVRVSRVGDDRRTGHADRVVAAGTAVHRGDRGTRRDHEDVLVAGRTDEVVDAVEGHAGEAAGAGSRHRPGGVGRGAGQGVAATAAMDGDGQVGRGQRVVQPDPVVPGAAVDPDSRDAGCGQGVDRAVRVHVLQLAGLGVVADGAVQGGTRRRGEGGSAPLDAPRRLRRRSLGRGVVRVRRLGGGVFGIVRGGGLVVGRLVGRRRVGLVGRRRVGGVGLVLRGRILVGRRLVGRRLVGGRLVSGRLVGRRLVGRRLVRGLRRRLHRGNRHDVACGQCRSHQAGRRVLQAESVPDLVTQHGPQVHPAGPHAPAPPGGIHVDGDRQTGDLAEKQPGEVLNRERDPAEVDGRLGGRPVTQRCRCCGVQLRTGQGCVGADRLVGCRGRRERFRYGPDRTADDGQAVLLAGGAVGRDDRAGPDGGVRRPAQSGRVGLRHGTRLCLGGGAQLGVGGHRCDALGRSGGRGRPGCRRSCRGRPGGRRTLGLRHRRAVGLPIRLRIGLLVGPHRRPARDRVADLHSPHHRGAEHLGGLLLVRIRLLGRGRLGVRGPRNGQRRARRDHRDGHRDDDDDVQSQDARGGTTRRDVASGCSAGRAHCSGAPRPLVDRTRPLRAPSEHAPPGTCTAPNIYSALRSRHSHSGQAVIARDDHAAASATSAGRCTAAVPNR